MVIRPRLHSQNPNITTVCIWLPLLSDIPKYQPSCWGRSLAGTLDVSAHARFARYLQFFVNASIVLFCIYLAILFVLTVRRDVKDKMNEYSVGE